MLRNLARVLAWMVVLAPVFAQAQGLLIVTEGSEAVRLPRPVVIVQPWPHPHPPHPPYIPPHPVPPPTLPAMTYKISELEIHARIQDQIAQTQVSQSFVNTGSRQMEVSFVFPLPYDGAIDQMTLLVDGKEFPARLLKAEEARRMYEDIVRRNRDPALLEWMGTGLFRTSVFPVPPGAKRTVTLRYSQLCRKVEGLTDFLFPLSTAKYTSHPVEKINVRLTVESGADIKNVYSPTHPVEIKRPDERHAVVTYSATNEIPSSDFRLLYDVGKGKLSTRVLSYRPKTDDDGFFLLLASPQIKAADKERPRKTVVFAVDRSGSMSGKKIEQAKNAAKFIINNLRDGDLFNVIAYDSTIESFRPELQRYGNETRKAALGFVDGLYAGGSTNLNGAMQTALGQLQDSSQPSYVLFLTDGLPTTGETNEMKISENAKQSNKVRARVFTFGVGYDVNARLLDRLVRESFGQGEYVRPDEDIEERVSRLYGRIEKPVLTNVQIDVAVDEPRADEAKIINRVYPRGLFDLFAGEQLVVVGRYKKAGTAKVTVRGKVGKETQQFDFPAELVAKSHDESLGFVEKLWAVRRVGEIIEEIDLKGRNNELVTELIELATRHGILTPYTSFLADENVRLHDLTSNTRRADERLSMLRETSGYGGVMQRAAKGEMQRANQAGPALSASNSYGVAAGAAPAAPADGALFAGRGPAPGRQAAGARVAATEPTAVQAEQLQNVRNIGNRAFYRRNNQWVDSSVTESQQQSLRRVKQFSPEYFELARQNNRQMAQYLVFDEPVVLNVEGQAVLVEP